MEVTITLNLGQMRAELAGNDRKEVQEELVEFINFIKQNEDVLKAYVTWGFESTGKAESDEETGVSIDKPPQNSEYDFGDIPDRIGLDQATLSNYIGLDPDGNEPPYLNFDPVVLGESGSGRSEKQMRASLILLTLWRECLDIGSVMSPDLKDALRISGIDDTKLANMYQFNDNEGDRYFRREGSGQNTEIELTLPGQREGYDQIRRTIERLESDDGE